MNKVLARWNSLDLATATHEVLPCCGSQAWAEALALRRPVADEVHLLDTSSSVWRALSPKDWREAFDSHPRIGQTQPQTHATEASLRWSAQEQNVALSKDEAVQQTLQLANRRYEERFGRIFIVCAAGKTSSEILRILETRMSNDTNTELLEAAEQQNQITRLRLNRWLESS